MKNLFALLLLVSLVSVAHAANYYVRSGAGGSNNGTDWNNAWTGPASINWTTVNAGDNVWFAAGSYSAMTYGDSGTAANQINIYRVRATNSIPAAAAGWNSSYDGTVWIAGINVGGQSWVNLNGQIPYGGLCVTNDSSGGSHCVYFPSVSHSNRFENLRISGDADTTSADVQDVRCFHANFYADPTAHGLYVGHTLIQSNVTLLITLGMSDMILESNIWGDNNKGSTANHENVIAVTGATNCIFRFNTVTNWRTEGIMMDFNGASDPPCDGWDIYGNVWAYPQAGTYARFVESQYRDQYRVRVYNNTYVGGYYGITSGNGGTWHSTCNSSNNIWFGMTAGAFSFGGANNDYGLTDGTSGQPNGISAATSVIFQNYTAGNFNIVTNIGAAYPRDKGVNLGSSYNVDFAGNTRIGTWDIGAYESDGTSGGGGGGGDVTAPTCVITSPASVSSGSSGSYSTSSSTITVSGTSDDATATVTWSNSRGGAGTATGNTSWSQAGITLASGGNVLTFIATDPSLNASTTTLNVTYTVPAAGGTTNNVGTLRIY